MTKTIASNELKVKMRNWRTKIDLKFNGALIMREEIRPSLFSTHGMKCKIRNYFIPYRSITGTEIINIPNLYPGWVLKINHRSKDKLLLTELCYSSKEECTAMANELLGRKIRR